MERAVDQAVVEAWNRDERSTQGAAPRLVTGAPPRLARPFAYGLVALLIACVHYEVEWWPLTSFRLFADVRGPHQLGWEVVTVDRHSGEHPIDWGALPPGHKGWYSVASRLGAMNDDERARVLRAWAGAAAANGADVASVVVYRTTLRVPTEGAAAAAVVRRALRYELEVARR